MREPCGTPTFLSLILINESAKFVLENCFQLKKKDLNNALLLNTIMLSLFYIVCHG